MLLSCCKVAVLVDFCRQSFFKERTSDDSTYAESIINLVTELGRSYLLQAFEGDMSLNNHWI